MIESSRKSPVPAALSGAPIERTEPAGRQRATFGVVDRLIPRVADTDVQVILRGEPGTGKEIVARAIHGASARRSRPFIKVDCAAPPQALEAELFGWPRGSAPGPQSRPGRLEFAQDGTLFLDHVLELPPALQLRLESMLEPGAPVSRGGYGPIPANVRFMAASDRDLERAVAEGRFRGALLFHLNGVCLTLSPLRQRRAELRELAEFFVRRYAKHYNKPPVSLSPDTIQLFSEYHWPGNLKELEGVVKRLVLLGSDASVREELRRSTVEPDPWAARARSAPEATPAGGVGADSTPEVAATTPLLPLKEIARQAADDAERELIVRTLQRTRWNRREAAASLGVSYKALLYKIKRAETSGAL
jgi:DNA-binding NtrC family response regulator